MLPLGGRLHEAPLLVVHNAASPDHFIPLGDSTMPVYVYETIPPPGTGVRKRRVRVRLRLRLRLRLRILSGR